MRIVILGLSITSSWGNGHATTFRGLVRELVARGHDVLFLERAQPWYQQNADLPNPPWGQTRLYDSVEELKQTYAGEVRAADAVIVGSYVPDGIAVGEWVNAASHGLATFYDIDTPVTLTALANGTCAYLTAELIQTYRIYFSFTGGPTLERLEREFGSPSAQALPCSVDPDLYFPEPSSPVWDLAYLGTYSVDRQPSLDALLIQAAARWTEGKFAVAGPQYPAEIAWPSNVERIEHLPPPEHRAFYNQQRATLNITRADMIAAGWSPSVRLFEAAACGTPIISDWWEGLDAFFLPDREIIIVRDADEVLHALRDRSPSELAAIGDRARERVLAEHTAAHRAAQLEAALSA